MFLPWPGEAEQILTFPLQKMASSGSSLTVLGLFINWVDLNRRLLTFYFICLRNWTIVIYLCVTGGVSVWVCISNFHHSKLSCRLTHLPCLYQSLQVSPQLTSTFAYPTLMGQEEKDNCLNMAFKLEDWSLGSYPFEIIQCTNSN